MPSVRFDAKQRMNMAWVRTPQILFAGFQMRKKHAGQRNCQEPFKDSAQHSLVPIPRFILAFLEVEDPAFH